MDKQRLQKYHQTRLQRFKYWLWNSPVALGWIQFILMMLSAAPFLYFGSRV